MDNDRLIDKTTLTWATGRAGIIRVHRTSHIPGKVAFYCFVEEVEPGIVMICGAGRGPSRQEASAIRHHLIKHGVREGRWERYDEKGNLIKTPCVRQIPAGEDKCQLYPAK